MAGMAGWPENGVVVAPFDGEISSVTDTRHAVGISSPDGMELLIHVGVDTVAGLGSFFLCGDGVLVAKHPGQGKGDADSNGCHDDVEHRACFGPRACGLACMRWIWWVIRAT